ncbi:MAG TPA: OmpA family protein [Flavobacterium sp.]|uniref:OmpA family protein n=1 Tax=Flavobacterium sp. TaxID=239 RepID=UPI002B993D0A|nr:OmpA family protein [Flavobacterium sp.]HSD14954.1 OmpA family protein [Flavobacterium sp.]
MKNILFFLTFVFFSQLLFSQESVSFYFDNNKSELGNEQINNLTEWINSNKNSKILSIIGSTDKKGTTESNKNLSLRRVDFLIKALDNQIKCREDFKTIGLGEKESKLFDNALDRKVTIYYLKKNQFDLEEFIINDFIVSKTIDSLKITDVNELKLSKKLSLTEITELTPNATLFSLEGIEFEFDSDILLGNSKRNLLKWAALLNEKPNIKIIIMGHICCVPRDDYKLSSRRAKAVKNFLIQQGISEERLQYIGYGASKPKYRIPEKNGYEALMNRRVEILIVDK